MICPECGVGELRVTHTYRAHEEASTRTKACTHCKQKFTEVLLLQRADRRGQGAAAVATRIRLNAVIARHRS
jgi:hypothetical protein